MEIIEYIDKMKEIYSSLQDFIDSDSDLEEDFKLFVKNLEKLKITESREDSLEFLQLLSIIGGNHHFDKSLFDKIELIIKHIQDEPNWKLFGINLFEIFESNKRLLYFLLYKKIINIDDHPEIAAIFPTLNDEFDEKYINGENDSYICTLIRKDLVEDFIIYVNQKNIKLSSTVPYSNYEANSILSRSTLIEYSVFYGSIQIFQYLKMNNVYLSPHLWIYAIHSNNAEMIYLLEENNVKPDDPTFVQCMIESIKCHHSNVANYIINEYRSVNNESSFHRSIVSTIISNKYYPFYPCEVDQLFNNPKSNFGFFISDFHFPLKTLTIPSFVTMIIRDIFKDNNLFEHVLFEQPSSLTLIEKFAFKDFTLLKEIKIPSSVKFIGLHAFSGSKSLENVSFDENSSLVSIGGYAFKGCSSLLKIKIPSSVKSIDDFCFENCTSLNQVDFENSSSLSVIGSSLFKKCKSLKRIEIPSSITRIGSGAFKECSSLSDILFDQNSSLKIIQSCAFEKCSSLEKISIPKFVISIDKNIFGGCSSLKEITVPKSIDISNFGIKSNLIINRI